MIKLNNHNGDSPPDNMASPSLPEMDYWTHSTLLPHHYHPEREPFDRSHRRFVTTGISILSFVVVLLLYTSAMQEKHHHHHHQQQQLGDMHNKWAEGVSKDHSIYFTSIEGEFEWNQLQSDQWLDQHLKSSSSSRPNSNHSREDEKDKKNTFPIIATRDAERMLIKKETVGKHNYRSQVFPKQQRLRRPSVYKKDRSPKRLVN